MNPRRFDSLTRTLATPKTRRGLLGSLAAVAAGLLGARATDAQVTQAQCGNVTCVTNPGVCKPGCVCCVYGNGNSRCRPPGTCSPGTVTCPPGQVVGPSGGCVAPLGAFGAACAASSDCASGVCACHRRDCVGGGLCATAAANPGAPGGGCSAGGAAPVVSPEGLVFVCATDQRNFFCAATDCPAGQACHPGGSLCYVLAPPS